MNSKIYKDSKGEWRWALTDPFNGNTLADSGEGYIHERDCAAALEKVTNAKAIQMVKNDLQLLIDTINRIQAGHKL